MKLKLEKYTKHRTQFKMFKKNFVVNFFLSQFTGKFKSIFINCMLLHTPSSVFQHIAEQLDPKWASYSKDALPFLEDKLTDRGPMM